MQGKTRVKAGGNGTNHTETLVRAKGQAPGLMVKTRIKAGGLRLDNHNETLVRAKGLTVKTRVKAGANPFQHNETLVRATPRQRSRV